MTNIVTTESGEKFTLFFTIRSPFSNFHPCRFTIFEDVGNGKPEERWYYSTEQYYMYHKALSAGDSETAEQIANERDARKIKMISRNIKNFERELWSKISSDVMRRGNFAKYTQNPLLRKKLFYTYGSTLVECSPTDLEWGIGLDINEPDALSPSKWRGKNKLGQILTEIREDLLLKPEYAHEVNDILSMLENFDSFSRQFFLPPKPPIQQCSCPSSGEYDRDYDKRRSLPSSTEIDRTNDGNRDKRYNLLSYPCAERSENIPDSSSRNTSNTNTKVENGSSSVHREECSQPARSSRKRNYRRMSSYGGDFKRHSSNDDPRNRRKTRSEKRRNVSNNSRSGYGIQPHSSRDRSSSESDRESSRFLKRQRRIGIGVDSNRLAASRIHHDCNVSSSSSEETSSSMGDVDIEIVKKTFEDPFKSLLKRLRNKKCGMWEQCAAES
ncbi:N-glycosidase [Dirofilaria immitis]